jgi:hypothetical protein
LLTIILHEFRLFHSRGKRISPRLQVLHIGKTTYSDIYWMAAAGGAPGWGIFEFAFLSRENRLQAIHDGASPVAAGGPHPALRSFKLLVFGGNSDWRRQLRDIRLT